MPQDLFSDSLVASPESQTPRFDSFDASDASIATGNDGYNEFTIHRQEGKRTTAQQLRTNRAKISERNDLHPYVQTLSLSHLDSCVALENAVFSEEERCSREKVGPLEAVLFEIHFCHDILYICLRSPNEIFDLSSRLFRSCANAFFLTARPSTFVCIARMVINPCTDLSAPDRKIY